MGVGPNRTQVRSRPSTVGVRLMLIVQLVRSPGHDVTGAGVHYHSVDDGMNAKGRWN